MKGLITADEVQGLYVAEKEITGQARIREASVLRF